MLAAASPARAGDVVSSSFAQLTGADGCMGPIGYTPTTGPACATGHGLLNAAAVVVAPDQKNVYVASSMSPEGGGSNAVLTFTRDTATGALTQTGCISDDGGDGRPGSDGLCTDGDVLAGANAIAISPDGKSVYAAAAAQSGLAVFARDPETGALTQTGCVKNYNDNDHCTQATGLRGVDAVDVSPDGAHVYAAARRVRCRGRLRARRGDRRAERASAASPTRATTAPARTRRRSTGASEIAVAPGRQLGVRDGREDQRDHGAERGTPRPAC